MQFIKWIHHLFNPHCSECAHEKECKTCETLRQLLETEKFEKKQLLEYFAYPKKEVESIQIEPISPKAQSIPWRVRQQMLEAEDREKAKILSRNTELEKELGIEEEVNAGR